MSLPVALRHSALRWIAEDVDEQDRAGLRAVLAAAIRGDPTAVDELADRMAGPLAFGTAGLRGPIRAGPNGMNRAVVVRTTAGVARWLTEHGHAGGIVVVGRDARHGSEPFARDAVAVLAAAGFDARLLPRPLPTPVLARAVRSLGAVAGVQVTASHNPPRDNGYKLYDDTGAQIAPPVDTEVEAAISAAPGAFSVPRKDSWTLLGEEQLSGYLSTVTRLPFGSARELRVVATALHGVGAEPLRAALDGFRDASGAGVYLVAEQSEPDPDFPTVRFPNPEEPGAADLLLALASEVDADVAVALDPDADRCALGVRERDGSWRMLRGDETGALLGAHLLSHLDRQAHPDPLVATTIVSSEMLARIAAKYGVRYAETLTGFKWLVRAGEGLVYAYEEALGLCVDPESVRDKDGISAAVLACDLAATVKASGRSLLDALDDLQIAHGVHLTGQVSVRVDKLSRIDEVMTALRAGPPGTLAGTPVVAEDLLPDADVLRLRGDGTRVVVRPSGTEPKLKTYLEVVAQVGEEGLGAARARATRRLFELRTEVTTLLDG
ncbi:MAG: phospho-sugar mutase [Sciscionella sp.]